MTHMRTYLRLTTLFTISLLLPASTVAQRGGSTHIVYGDINTGQIIQLYGFGSWSYTNLSTLTGARYLGGPLAGFSDSLGLHVFYLGGNQQTPHVYQLYYQLTSGTWLLQDITQTAGGPSAFNGSGLTSFADSLGEHVFYQTSDDHIHQLYGHNGWTDNDMTVLAGAPLAYNEGASLTSFADSLGEHAFYISQSFHVIQFYGHNTWTAQDLTALSGATVTAAVNGMSSFADTFGEHVFYIGAQDDRVHQLYGHNTWTDSNLMATSPYIAAGYTTVPSFGNSNGEDVFFATGATTPYADVMWLCGCNGSWQLTDLTSSTAGGEPHQNVNSDTVALTFSNSSGNVEQAAYMGLLASGQSDRHVYVEYWTSRVGWQITDLTAATGAPDAPIADGYIHMTGFME